MSWDLVEEVVDFVVVAFVMAWPSGVSISMISMIFLEGLRRDNLSQCGMVSGSVVFGQ